MPLSFRIFPDRGLVHVRYSGLARLTETREALAAFGADPLSRRATKHLIDLSAVTGFELDFMELFRLQAQKAEIFLPANPQTLMVYYAPHETAQRMAWLAERSWDPAHPVVVRVQQSEADALALLGLSERSIAELEAGAA